MLSNNFDEMRIFSHKDFDRLLADVHRVYRWGLLVVLLAGVGIGWFGGATVSWWMR